LRGRASALSLVLSLTLASPGPFSTRAFAGVVAGKSAPVSGFGLAAGNIPLPALAAPLSLSLGGTLAAPGLASSALVTLDAPLLSPAASEAAAAPRTLPAAPPRVLEKAAAFSPTQVRAPSRTPPAARSPAAARGSLEAGAASLAEARSPEQSQIALNRLFSGFSRPAAGAEAAAVSPGAPRTLRSGLQRKTPQNAADAAEPKAPPTQGKTDDDGFSPEQKRGIMGMFLSRPFGMVGFSLSAMAYPLMLIDSVGKASMYDLFSIGGIISIGMNVIVGKIGDHMPLKKYIVYNNVLRSGLALANAALYAMGFLNFSTLLLLTVVNSFQFASLFITDQAMTAEIVGPHRNKIRSTEAMIGVASILTNIASGMFLGSIIVDTLGFVWTFGIVSAVTAVPAFILWKTLPDIGYKPGRKPLWTVLKELPANAARALRSLGEGVPDRASARGYLINGAVLAASVLGYLFVYQTPFWIIGAMSLVLMRSDVFRRVIMKNTLLKLGLVLVMVTAFVEVPMRNAVLGALSQEISGEMGNAAFYGKLIAAFYMGQLVTGTGMLSEGLDIEIGKIGPWKLKKPVSFNLKKTMRWVGALVLTGWTMSVILPAGWLAAALAPVIIKFYHLVHDYTPKVSDAGWLRMEAIGLLAVGIPPLLFWGNFPVLFGSLFLFGMLHNPAARTISATFSQQAKQHADDNYQFISGIKGSFFTMAVSSAYALYGLAKVLPEKLWGITDAFPFTWYVVAALYAAIAVIFLIGSKVMPFGDAEKNKKK